MSFNGFAIEDFEVFMIPGFADRMTALRARVRPKLLALGEELAAPLSEVFQETVHPHAAAHMRRRVNPPEETWVAFSRDARGYKRWTHFRVAVSASGIRTTIFVEDDADDKPRLAAALQKQARRIRTVLSGCPVEWYTLNHAGTGGKPAQPSEAALRELGKRLAVTKTAAFQAGLSLASAEQAAALRGPEFFGSVLEAAGNLAPLYRAGARGAL